MPKKKRSSLQRMQDIVTGAIVIDFASICF